MTPKSGQVPPTPHELHSRKNADGNAEYAPCPGGGGDDRGVSNHPGFWVGEALVSSTKVRIPTSRKRSRS